MQRKGNWFLLDSQIIFIHISRGLRAKTYFFLDILADTGPNHMGHSDHHMHKEPTCSFVRTSFLCYLWLEMDLTKFQGYVVLTSVLVQKCDDEVLKIKKGADLVE